VKLINILKSALLGLALLGPDLASSTHAEVPAGYQVVFSDEFAAPQLDVHKWITTMHFAGVYGERFHNRSYLNYNLDENVLFNNGVLQLRTDRKTTEGTSPAGVYQYTGGLVSTEKSFAFKYGYVEIRAKYPGGRGIWPVFWLMPNDPKAWPPEFDIAEYYAGSSVMHNGLCHGDVHDPKWDSTGITDSKAELDFHTYALEWSPGRAVWYQDGVIRKVIEAAYVPDAPMYIILNNGVSSHIGPSGSPNDQTVFPNFFEIDYVRVYQLGTPVVIPANSVAMIDPATVAPVAIAPAAVAVNEAKAAPAAPAPATPVVLPVAGATLP
jgi:beta-glucanase (GH16 family)